MPTGATNVGNSQYIGMITISVNRMALAVSRPCSVQDLAASAAGNGISQSTSAGAAASENASPAMNHTMQCVVESTRPELPRVKSAQNSSGSNQDRFRLPKNGTFASSPSL